MDESRKAFEEHCRTLPITIVLSTQENGQYYYFNTQARWEGWQAATAESQQQLVGLQLLNQQYREALDKLYSKVKELQPAINSQTTFCHNHGIKWTAGNWVAEMENAEQALATTSPTDALGAYTLGLFQKFQRNTLEGIEPDWFRNEWASIERRMKKGE